MQTHTHARTQSVVGRANKNRCVPRGSFRASRRVGVLCRTQSQSQSQCADYCPAAPKYAPGPEMRTGWGDGWWVAGADALQLRLVGQPRGRFGDRFIGTISIERTIGRRLVVCACECVHRSVHHLSTMVGPVDCVSNVFTRHSSGPPHGSWWWWVLESRTQLCVCVDPTTEQKTRTEPTYPNPRRHAWMCVCVGNTCRHIAARRPQIIIKQFPPRRLWPIDKLSAFCGAANQMRTVG